jgi:dolichol-phosphate mannosyltransferase
VGRLRASGEFGEGDGSLTENERALVIVPTYNERANIERIIATTLAQDPRLEMLIVDDNSPDGTGQIVDALAECDSRVHALHRAGKMGLGTAYVAGFRWALEQDYAYVFEMDADFSHDPAHLTDFLRAIVTGLALDDSTGGFKCFRRRVLEAIDLSAVKSNGYAFQIEMSFRAWKKGFRIVEIPIVFVDRTEGTSKMSQRIVREAVWMVWRLRWWSITGRL